MTISEITSTKQMDFSFEKQGFGAVAVAARLQMFLMREGSDYFINNPEIL